MKCQIPKSNATQTIEHEEELKKAERKRNASRRKRRANEARAESTSSKEGSTERGRKQKKQNCEKKRILRQRVQKQRENSKMNHEVFMQWNVQRMTSSKEDMVKLIETYKPIVIAAQETCYGEDFINNIGGYRGM